MEQALVELVWQRASRRCEYCHVLQAHDPLAFQIDHIIARKHRGATVASNLCLACLACNNHKGPNVAGVDPLTKKVVPLFNPRRHKWHVHFRWDGPVLVGVTPAGRATVNVLEMNLDYRIDFRQSLIDEGAFPKP
jgi:hypothetical protein